MGSFRRLRTYFFTGLVVSAPIGITVWLAWWFVSLFDQWIKPMIPAIYNPDSYVPFSVPGVGLMFALIGITFIGFLAANLVGRTILSYWEYLLGRMPVVRSVYKGTKQIFQTAFAQEGATFEKVGIVEYPRKGVHVVVFVARELDSGEIGLAPGQPMVACFMPTTPNPTSGFLFFLHHEEVEILDLTVEEGAKLVISAGLVTPRKVKASTVASLVDAEIAAESVRNKTIRKTAKKPVRKPSSKSKVSRPKAT